MNAITRAARAYYRGNIQVWEALRRSPAGQLPGLIGLYLALTIGLNLSGHTTAAWVATVAIGIPLLAAGWTT
jgi:hypothetical protein